MTDNRRGTSRSGDDTSARNAFKQRVRGRESAGNDRVTNRTGSTASGRYQFTHDTWVRMHQQVYGGRQSAAERWAQRFNPDQQERLMDASIDSYVRTLRAGGQGVTDGNLYLSHFFGPETAVRILQNPNASLRSILGRNANKVFAQNPNLNDRMTGADAAALTNRAMSGRGRAISSRPAAQPDTIYSDGRAMMQSLTRDEVLNMRPDSISRRPLEAQAPDPTRSPVARADQHTAALTGGHGLPVGGPAPDVRTPNMAIDHEAEGEAVAAQRYADNHSTWERFEATWEDWIGTQAINSLSREHFDADPRFMQQYTQNWQQIERFAENDREVYEMREATSWGDLEYIQNNIVARRERDRLIDSGGHGTLLRLIGGVTDPSGVLGALGGGEALNLARIGSRSLMAAGRPVAAIGSHIAESTGVNLALTAALDAAGEHMDGEDYRMSLLSGLGIGTITSPFVFMGRPHTGTYDSTVGARNALEQARQGRLDQARTNLGPDATPEAVHTEAARIDTRNMMDVLRASLSDVPDDLRFLSENPEELLTANPSVRSDVEGRFALDLMHDEGERGMAAEMIARAERFNRDNPVNADATRTVLARVGMEDTGLTLMRSESPVARAAGSILLEGSTGAGGRRITAAMQQAQRERVYLRHMTTYDQLYHMYRRERGTGLISEGLNGEVRREFNNRVFDEVEARGGSPEGTHFDESPMVREAADLWERGMDAMRVEQQHVGVVGSARLGGTSRGYMTHRLDATKVADLTPKQRRTVRNIIASQLSGADNGFDAEFSQKLATKYLERAERRVGGSHDVPMNLWSAEAADIVRDSLEAMNIGSDEVEKLMGKFSRGGASHTKKRLRLDLQAPIGDGMVLRDLYNTDIGSLYSSYARRVSGEVALAQYGIMGKKGLNVLRTAIETSAPAAERANTLRAFDQVASEFLNTPFGKNNHVAMDNTRILTSLSRLGGMGFTQFGEFGNALAALGVHKTFAAIGGLRRMRREVVQLAKGGGPKNPILQSLDLMGGHLGLDDFNATRIFDVRESNIKVYNGEHIGVVTRTLRQAGHMQAVLSGHRTILATQTRLMAEQIVHKAVGMVKAGTDDIHLRDMGFTPELQAALSRNLDRIATFDSSGRLVELDLFKGDLSPHELRSISHSVERGAGQIIQRTYIGETGKWAHDGFLKMLLQFRTFSLVSVSKQWGRGVQLRGGGRMAAVRASMALMGAMSFAVPIYLARVQLKMMGMSRSERAKYAEQNTGPTQLARATLNYASASGLLPDILDIGGGFMHQFGDGGEAFANAVGARGQGQGQLLGGVVAPGAGLVQDIWGGLNNLTNDHAREKLLRTLPGSNLPYIAPILNGITADE